MWRGPNHALPGRTPVFFGKELQRPSERDSSVLRKRTQAFFGKGLKHAFATAFHCALRKGLMMSSQLCSRMLLPLCSI